MPLLFLLLFSLGFAGEAPTLPRAIPGVNEIIQELRAPLKTKLGDLGKNYIATRGENSLGLKSHMPVVCNGKVVAAGLELARLSYRSKRNGDELFERGGYVGCNESESFIEEVISIGAGAKPMEFDLFLKGEREADLTPGVSSRLYRLKNGEGEEIFRSLVQKKGDEILSQFYFREQLFLAMNKKLSPNEARVTITYHGFNARYSRGNSNWSMNRGMFPTPNVAIVKGAPHFEEVYLNSSGERISLTSFLESFNGLAMESVLLTTGKIVSAHLTELPPTEAVSSGTRSQRILNEMRLILVKLISNTEINFVRLYIQEFIAAIEQGKIIDNREDEP
jgi:hypothetical protein